MKPIVPVGARTVACAFRYPCCRPDSIARSQTARWASKSSLGTPPLGTPYAASRCMPVTSRNASRFGAYPAKGPSSAAIFEEVRNACPCMRLVTTTA
jgi:hypothetical protein